MTTAVAPPRARVAHPADLGGGRDRPPRRIVVAAVLAALGLALTVPFSAPDGTGMQWDELVLGLLACWTCRSVFGATRGAARPSRAAWRVVGVGAALFAVAQLLEAAFPGPEFDGFGVDKVLLFAGACTPLATCAVLAMRVHRTRWSALLVDGLTTTVGLFVVAAVLAAPDVGPEGAPAGLRPMVLLYGGYAAIMLGAAGTLCTVATAALRRSVSAMMGAVACQATAACCEAMAIVAPHPLWTAGSDAAVAVSLLLALLATLRAPAQLGAPGTPASAPRVSVAGLALVVLGVLALPLALTLSIAQHRPLPVAAEAGCALVFVLMAARLVLRMREDGRLSRDLIRTEEDFRELVETSSDGVAIVDAGLRLLFASPAARELLGIAPEHAGGTSLLALVERGDRDPVAAALHGAIPAGEPAIHFAVRTADGGSRELEMTTSERPGSGRRVLHLRDVTSRRRRERELERLAYSDHLTGLPNRALLFRELAAAPGDDGERCLLVLDLDGFKAVNDQAGHEAGDQLLVEVSRRLRTVVREEDLVARLGGDEFAVVVSGSLGHATEVAQRAVQALALPHVAGGRTFALGGSVGVAALAAAGGQVAFREADAALREAKRAGKGCVRVAGRHRDGPAPVADLTAALAAGRVRVRFDAAVDAAGRAGLVHAVPVWDDPDRGTVPGPEVWAAAEQQGIVADLQEWLLDRACAAVADVDGDLRAAVSLPNGAVAPEGLGAMVRRALATSGLSPSRLILSFTEETLLTSSAALVPELEAVRAMGVALCLDQYGMGQSLFALMARVPIDVVRADLNALTVRNDGVRAHDVLDAIVHITRGLGVAVVAGGARTPEALAAARATGVQLVHGLAVPHGLTREDLADLVGEPVASR